MINVLKKIAPLFVALMLVAPVDAQRSSRSNSATNNSTNSNSSTNTNNNSGSNSSSNSNSNSSSKSGSSSHNERAARPVQTRPSRSESRPQGQAASSNHFHNESHHGHHEPPPPPRDHHHHHGGGDVVVVVEDDDNYTTSNYSSATVSGDYDLDRFMLYANLGFGMSFRGFSGELDYELDDPDHEDNKAFGSCLGYNIELRCDIGMSKHTFFSTGAGFAKQSFYNMFWPGNYMKSTKRFLDIPLMFGYRKSSDEGFWGSVAVGPRLAYGINGDCVETYDFYPAQEYGEFKHSSYGGEYGVKRFAVGVGLEANIGIEKFLLGFSASFYPHNDCKPGEIYDGLYKRFYNCRTNITFKAGWRIF